jgi:hypothetical protein
MMCAASRESPQMLDLLLIGLFQAATGEPAVAMPAAGTTEQTSPSVPAAAPTESTDPRDRVVCRTEETTSSRVRPRRVCLSQNDRDRLNRENRREMDEAARHGGPGTSEGN